MNNDNKPISDKLEGLYNIAIKQDDDGEFLNSLYSYLEYLLKDKYLSALLESTIKHSRDMDDGKRVRWLKHKLFREACNKISEFEQFFKEHNMLDTEAMGETKRFHELRDRTLRMNEDLEESLINEVDIVLGRIKNDSPGKVLIDKYGVFNADGILIDWKWSPYQYRYREKRNIYDRLAPVRVWYWWDHLYYLYMVFHDYEKHRKKFYDQREWFIIAGFSESLNEIERIRKGEKFKKSDNHIIRPWDLRTYLDRFHFNFMQELIERSDKTLVNQPNTEEGTKSKKVFNNAGFNPSHPDFPSDLRWQEVFIKFINSQEVIVTIRHSNLQSNYEMMGFQDMRRKLPNKQWNLLELLSKRHGELSWSNNADMKLRDRNSVAKQKQLLAKKLKLFFKVNEDPFNNYKSEHAYRTKFRVDPEES